MKLAIVICLGIWLFFGIFGIIITLGSGPRENTRVIGSSLILSIMGFVGFATTLTYYLLDR